MMKLQRLTSSMPTLGGKVKVLDVTPGATKRLKGPKYQGPNGRNNLWLMYHPICAECQRQELGEDMRPAVEVDHTVPLWEGGPDDDTNLQSLCRTHHDEKTLEETKRRMKMMNEPIG